MKIKKIDEMDSPDVPDVPDLPDLNPVTSAIGDVRSLIVKGGIPVLLVYNGAKALAVGIGAYMVCPGGTEVKAIAAGAAGVGLLSASPTFWAAGALIATKIGVRVLRATKTD